ncbi:MAG: hypothetical protein FJZ01_05720 [Candidatus Sericytochromatia bacterium]|nr:hypothetical protein [Candidatus Tanganyikabacteria bacterium]
MKSHARRAALALGALVAWACGAAPAAATPGEPLAAALRWLATHPYLGPPRLAPVEGLGVLLAFDAWQAARKLPEGEVRLVLDVPEPHPHPPVKREYAENRVRRELLVHTQRAPGDGPPPIAELLARIYGPRVAAEYRAAEPIPLGADDLPNGENLAGLGIGPLRLEYAVARRGGNLEFTEAAYRGEEDPFAKATYELRRTVVAIVPGAGEPPVPPPPPTVIGARPR